MPMTMRSRPDDAFPWCLIQDGGVSDRYATKDEAEEAAAKEGGEAVYQPFVEDRSKGYGGTAWPTYTVDTAGYQPFVEKEPQDFCVRCMRLDADCRCYAPEPDPVADLMERDGLTEDEAIAAHRPGILTVGELRQRLEGVDPTTHVAIVTKDWWDNVADTQRGDPPDGHEFALDPAWHASDPGPFRPCEFCGVAEEDHYEKGHFTFDLIPGEPVDTRQF